jgi:hypothetical protein
MTKRKKVPFFEIVEFPTQVTLTDSEFAAIQTEFEVEDRGVFFDSGEQLHVVIVLSKKETKEAS